jgi:hypothetical protein
MPSQWCITITITTITITTTSDDEEAQQARRKWPLDRGHFLMQNLFPRQEVGLCRGCIAKLDEYAALHSGSRPRIDHRQGGRANGKVRTTNLFEHIPCITVPDAALAPRSKLTVFDE